ncbi:MAG: DUF402 domain-containing protein [Chloroflexota bacterium]
MRRFEQGDRIEVREVWRGKTWERRANIVVQDTPELIALYTPPNSPAYVALDEDGEVLRFPSRDWTLSERPVPAFELIALHVPGHDHSVLAIFNPMPRHTPWYINLESDLERTDFGFQYEDHLLDVLVERDLETWRWKDEDELEEAVALGLFTQDEAAKFYAAGERALEWLTSRRSPYDRDWLAWRPPSEWVLPT